MSTTEKTAPTTGGGENGWTEKDTEQFATAIAAVLAGLAVLPVMIGWLAAPKLARLPLFWRREGAVRLVGAAVLVAAGVGGWLLWSQTWPQIQALADQWLPADWEAWAWEGTSVLVWAWVFLLPAGVVASWARGPQIAKKVDEESGDPHWGREVSRVQDVAADQDAQFRADHAPTMVAGRAVLGAVADPSRRGASERMVARNRHRDPSAYVVRQNRRLSLGRAVEWFAPFPNGALRAAVIGSSGGGKTSVILAVMADQLARGERVAFFDCKAAPDDLQKFIDMARAAGVPAERIKVFPQDGYDMFTGTAQQVTDLIFSVLPKASGDAEYYRRSERWAVRAACAANGRTPASKAELVARLRNPRDWADRATFDRLEEATKGKKLHLAAAELVEEEFLSMDDMLSGDWSWGTDWQFVLFPVRGPAKEKAAIVALNGLEQWRETRSPTDTALTVYVDEAACLLDHEVSPILLSQRLEQYRALAIGFVLLSQSVHGLGQQAQRILGSGVSVLAGQGLSQEDMSALGGTVRRSEGAYDPVNQVAGSIRSQHQFAIDPNRLRTAKRGRWALFEPGQEARWIVMTNPNV